MLTPWLRDLQGAPGFRPDRSRVLEMSLRFSGWISGTILLLATLPVFAQTGSAPGGAPAAIATAQPNSARFPAVTLFAYPTDARGLLVGGLHPQDFRVTENGQPAQITEVESDGNTIDVCLALDRSPSMLEEDKLLHAKAAANQFLSQLGPDDHGALITFANGSSLDQPLTRDKRLLHAAVDRTQATGETTTFMDAVYWAITQVALHGPGGSIVSTGPVRSDSRRVVVALTDGIDRSSRVQTQELLDYAHLNGVSLCMVAVGSDAATGQMKYLADQTGGIYLAARQAQDLEGLYLALARQLRREYRITFRTPRPSPDGTRREVRLTTTSGVSGDAWYLAPVQGNLLAGTATAPPAAPGVETNAVVRTPTRAPAGPLVGIVLVALLLMGAGGAFLLWRRTQSEGLAIVDSNPRLDLLPLWVREGSTRVGRGSECELVLDSRQVSRVHAIIETVNGAYLLVDEGSRNGTYVNGKRVRNRRELRVGDRIRFGDREFRFAGALEA